MGKEYLSYKNIIHLQPDIDKNLDFIIYNKNNLGEKVYGFNGVKTVTKKVSESQKLKLPGVRFWHGKMD